jgi:hypothetical protein
VEQAPDAITLVRRPGFNDNHEAAMRRNPMLWNIVRVVPQQQMCASFQDFNFPSALAQFLEQPQALFWHNGPRRAYMTKSQKAHWDNTERCMKDPQMAESTIRDRLRRLEDAGTIEQWIPRRAAQYAMSQSQHPPQYKFPSEHFTMTGEVEMFQRHLRSQPLYRNNPSFRHN